MENSPLLLRPADRDRPSWVTAERIYLLASSVVCMSVWGGVNKVNFGAIEALPLTILHTVVE